MKAHRRSACILLTLFASTTLFAAQKQVPPAQTARQAFLEMIKGGQQGVTKHLTSDVQQLLSKPENSKAAMALRMFSSFKDQAGGQMQTFDAGPVLLSMDDPRERAKVEVRVDSDNLNGDEDTIEFSVHMLRDGQEVQEEWTYFLSHLSLTMVRQQNVWRLNKVAVGMELPFGDPEFFKQLFLSSAETAKTSAKAGADVHAELRAVEPVQPVELPPEQMLTMLAITERAYAGQHPDIGFTCSLADLAEAGQRFMLNQQIAGGNYGAYKITVTGCQGKPAGSFQIIFEPASGSGGKAFCTDATQNIRMSDDGRGATCLISGRTQQSTEVQDGMVGFRAGSSDSGNAPKK